MQTPPRASVPSREQHGPIGFNRKPLQGQPLDKFLVESTCIHCGNQMIGSYFDMLEEREQEHREKCRPSLPDELF